MAFHPILSRVLKTYVTNNSYVFYTDKQTTLYHTTYLDIILPLKIRCNENGRGMTLSCLQCYESVTASIQVGNGTIELVVGEIQCSKQGHAGGVEHCSRYISAQRVVADIPVRSVKKSTSRTSLRCIYSTRIGYFVDE